MNYNQWKDEVKQNRPNERLGQAFIKDFYNGLWTELYYTNDEGKAQRLIMDHLVDTQYWPEVPPKLSPIRYIPK